MNMNSVVDVKTTVTPSELIVSASDVSVDFGYTERIASLNRPIEILLLKPYEAVTDLLHSPPLGFCT